MIVDGKTWRNSQEIADVSHNAFCRALRKVLREIEIVVKEEPCKPEVKTEKLRQFDLFDI